MSVDHLRGHLGRLLLELRGSDHLLLLVLRVSLLLWLIGADRLANWNVIGIALHFFTSFFFEVLIFFHVSLSVQKMIISRSSFDRPKVFKNSLNMILYSINMNEMVRINQHPMN